jgi:hypothetical protein
MHLCTCVSEEGCDGEAACSETPSLLSYTLTYKSTHGLVVYYGLADFWGKEKKRKQKSRSPNIGSKTRGLAWATFRKGLQYRTTNLSFVV